MPMSELDRDSQRRIDQQVLYYATIGRDELDERLEQLEREWDMDRWLLMLTSGLSVVALLSGGRRKGRWSLLSGMLGALLLSNALEEPSASPLLRRLGIRTRTEIAREQQGLLVIRGDMDALREDLQETLHQALHELESEELETVSH